MRVRVPANKLIVVGLLGDRSGSVIGTWYKCIIRVVLCVHSPFALGASAMARTLLVSKGDIRPNPAR